MKKILITGCAGFIGYHLTEKLIKDKKYRIYGIDSLNNYYDISLKKKRLANLTKFSTSKFNFYKIDLKQFKKIEALFKKHKFDYVIHLAAQAGVRYSITNPDTYISNNLFGFYNLMKLSAIYKIKHFMFASSSSVYGNVKKFPLTDHYPYMQQPKKVMK